MIFFIDFDNTICSSNGEPLPGCIETIRKLKETNTIVIYSCRSNDTCVENPLVATQEMVNFLTKHEIPYDKIKWGKPFFNYIIDDRALGCPLDSKGNVDWTEINKLLEKLNG